MRMSPPSLLPLFRSESQVKLLALLLLQPERAWSLQELASALPAPASSVHRELGRAIDAGIVTRDDRKRPHEFSAASSSPSYAPLRALLDQTVGVPRLLAAALEPIPGVLAGAIHGSWATGTARPDSDIDVIVVTRGDRQQVVRAVRDVGRSVGRDIDVTAVAVDEFVRLREGRNPFLGKILKGPRLDVVGDLATLRDSA